MLEPVQSKRLTLKQTFWKKELLSYKLKLLTWQHKNKHKAPSVANTKGTPVATSPFREKDALMKPTNVSDNEQKEATTVGAAQGDWEQYTDSAFKLIATFTVGQTWVDFNARCPHTSNPVKSYANVKKSLKGQPHNIPQDYLVWRVLLKCQ